jgi:proton-dependent oligopeptide transporter, POT family
MQATATEERTFLGHPLGLYVLFFTEMWERFSFYSMRAFLVLYMTQALAFSSRISSEIYGAYLGFVYAATFLGGILADRLLGQRRCIVIGGLMMAAAQFMLAGHAMSLGTPVEGVDVLARDSGLFSGIEVLLFLGMGMLAGGNGFFKPNISTIVGTLYEQGDARRDGAFTIFYMGINIGAFLAGFSGQVAQQVGWHWGFLMAGIGMLIGQLIFFAGRRYLKGKGLPPRRVDGGKVGGAMSTLSVLLGVVVLVPTMAYLMSRPSWVQGLAVWIALPVLAYLLWEAFRSTREERGRMIVIIILCSFSMMFWGFFELAGSAINLFTDEKVDRVLPLVGTLEASLLTASINPLFIVLLGIPFAKLWVWLDKRRMEPSSPLKFALGLAQLGAGFFVLYLGAIQAGQTGKCNISFLIFGFMLHTTGELCLSPVGLSTITKLSPVRFVGMFMGVWFLSSALGNVFAGRIGGWVEEHGFDYVFRLIGIISILAAVFLLVLVKPLKRMMYGIK